MNPHAAPAPGDWCISRLEEADDYFLSTHELWREYTGDKRNGYMDYEQFEHELRFDKGLYVTRGTSSHMPATHEEILRQMGFPLRAMVAFADRKPPQGALDNAVYAKALQLQRALLKLWQARQ